jgi:3-oxoacyl-[acyl-carrier-protein] synthase-3
MIHRLTDPNDPGSSCGATEPSIAIAVERCGVPVEKCHTIMEKYGYTGSACIPMALDDAIELGKMALDDAIELGKIKRGDLVVIISPGLGYSQAAAAVRLTV